MKLLVVICVFVVAANAIKLRKFVFSKKKKNQKWRIFLASNFKTCNRKQANFRGCLLEAARFGVTQLNRPYKELKMISLDPLVIPKIEASVDAQLLNISSELTDCKFFNIVQLDIQKFE